MQIGVSEGTARDWILQRNKKKLQCSEGAFNYTRRELEKAMTNYGFEPEQCISYAILKGWAGFMFSYLGEQDIRAIRGEEQSINYTGNGIEAPIAKNPVYETSPEMELEYLQKVLEQERIKSQKEQQNATEGK